MMKRKLIQFRHLLSLENDDIITNNLYSVFCKMDHQLVDKRLSPSPGTSSTLWMVLVVPSFDRTRTLPTPWTCKGSAPLPMPLIGRQLGSTGLKELKNDLLSVMCSDAPEPAIQMFGFALALAS